MPLGIPERSWTQKCSFRRPPSSWKWYDGLVLASLIHMIVHIFADRAWRTGEPTVALTASMIIYMNDAGICIARLPVIGFGQESYLMTVP